MSEKKNTDAGDGVEKRVTRLEALVRIAMTSLRNIEARVGEVHDEEAADKAEKSGKASIWVMTLVGLVGMIGMAVAATVTPPAGSVAVFGYPPVAYIDASGNMEVGGSSVSKGGTATGATNVTPVLSLPVSQGGTFTGATNASPVLSLAVAQGGAYTGATNVTPTIRISGTNYTFAVQDILGTNYLMLVY